MKFQIVFIGLALTLEACGSGTISSGVKSPTSETAAVGPMETINGKPSFKVSKFSAKYFKGTDLVASETVDRVAINYAWSDFHEISSESFRASWKGELAVLKDQTLNFNFDASWSEVVLRIDGVETAKWRDSSKVLPLLLMKGTHVIEVDYINHWHTTSFNMSITQNNSYDKQTVRSALAPLMDSDTRLVIFGAYESGNRYNDLKVILSGEKTPVFLVLVSFNAVHWIIDNPNNIPIAGIIYNSTHSSSTIEADSFVPKFEVKDLANEYENFPQSSADMKELFGRGPTKTIGAYSPVSLKL